jgi:hypothetical protein
MIQMDTTYDISTKSTSKTAKVLDLAAMRPDYRYPALSQLEAYWHAKRGERLMPNRADINPRGIEDTLEFAFISEEIASGMARFRLAGMHLTDLMGFDVRGMPMSSLFKPNARTEFREALQAVFEGPQIVKLDLTSNGSFGVPALEGRLILLPLCDEDGKVTRLLGALSTVGPIGRSPRTFEIVRSTRIALIHKSRNAHPDAVAHVHPAKTPADLTQTSDTKKQSYLTLLNFDN